MAQAKVFGAELPNWAAVSAPGPNEIVGKYATLARLQADKHAAEIYRANSKDDAIWDYLPYGPFSSAAGYHRWARSVEESTDPFFYAVKDNGSGEFCGVLSYLRITPEVGSIEVGHVNFAPQLQQTRAATEAFYLMMDWAFASGYRRFEWKCDANNTPSRRAAQRLGLSYEGIFRQATIVKGRNRDTAWFAAIDSEWPALKEAFKTWLSPSNFAADGQQKESLKDLTGLVRAAGDPLLG